MTRKTRLLTWVWSILLSMIIIFANYFLLSAASFTDLLLSINLCLGVFYAWYNIILWIALHKGNLIWRIIDKKWKPGKVFAVTFVIIAAAYLTVLFLTNYPGNATVDSYDQLKQILMNNYQNHHPFWHTMTIKVFFDLGFSLFHNINDAFATYSFFLS